MFVLLATAGDRPDLLARTLRSLLDCSRPEGFQGVWVVENGPHERCRELMQEFSALPVNYLHSPRPNKSDALNVALAQIGNGLVFLTDDDVRFDRNVLMAFARADAAHKTERAYFGGVVEVDYEEPPPPWLISMLPSSARGYRPNGHHFIGNNWAARAEEIRSLGGFNPEFGPGSPTGATGQESEMQDRLFAAGFLPVPVEDAIIWHFVPKERCSVDWTVARAYRTGMKDGLRVARRADPMRIGWALVRSLQRYSAGWTSRHSTGEEARVRARWKAEYYRGLVAGIAEAFHPSPKGKVP
jgi:glycosyltransferase involved in cell wall biosynthesis